MLVKILTALWIMKQKKEKILNTKKHKNNEMISFFIGSANSYNIEILSSFTPERQLKDTESAIKNKLMEGY